MAAGRKQKKKSHGLNTDKTLISVGNVLCGVPLRRSGSRVSVLGTSETTFVSGPFYSVFHPWLDNSFCDSAALRESFLDRGRRLNYCGVLILDMPFQTSLSEKSLAISRATRG